MMKNLLVWVLMMTLTSVFGQTHPFISDFRAIKDRDNVLLTWTIRQGSICFGIGVWRSADDLNYELVGRIDGECGSIDKEKIYSWLDEKPDIPGKNYYKLEIGIEGRTEPGLLVDFIDFGKNGLVILPNPIVERAEVTFWNPNNELHEMHVFTSNGQIITKSRTTDDHFEIIIPKNSTLNTSQPLWILIVNQKTKALYSGKLILSKD